MLARKSTINMKESKFDKMQQQLDEEACIEMCKKFDAIENPDKFKGITIEEYAKINGISL